MSIITVCREAWNTTKRDHQPAFDDLVLPYQHMLQQRAEGAIASGVPNDDGQLASFDRAAIGCNAAMAEVPAEVKEELVEEVEAELPKVEDLPQPPKPVLLRAPKKKAAPKVEKKEPQPKVKVVKKLAQKGAKKR